MAVILIVLLFILSGCSSPAEIAQTGYKYKSGQDLTFCIISDPHYLAKDLTDNGEAFKKYVSSSNGTQLNYIDKILDAFIFEMKNKKPDILVISGDLTSNGEKKSHIEFAKKLSIIEENGTSVYVVPGNHDILNPWARGFKGDEQYVAESISDKDFSRIYGAFGFDEAVSRDKYSLSYLVQPSEDLWLLMIDSNKYKNNFTVGYPQMDGELSKGTLDWIKKCTAMAKEKGANIITVMHHNVLDHDDIIRKDYTLNNSKEALEVFKEGNLHLVLSGHDHIQDIISDKKDSKTLYGIASGSIAVYPHLYGTLKYSDRDKSISYNTSIVDVEGWSRYSGINDKNLNNFKNYSEDYFSKFAYDTAYKQLMEEGGYSNEEIKTMAETVKTLSLRYFAGTENLNSKDVLNSEGYKLWLKSPDNGLKQRVLDISSDRDTDDNNIKFSLKDN
jgi:3',5'-cyclic AMP phosphodiesterase CpdA